MIGGIGGGGFGRVFQFTPQYKSADPLTPQRALELNRSTSDVEKLQQLQVNTANLRRSLRKLGKLIANHTPTPVSSASTASTTGTGPLAINVSATSGRLESSTEVNARSTSFGPFGPAWQGAGGSDTLFELDGTYTGDIDGVSDQEITVKVVKGGTVGEDTITLGIYDQNGEHIKNKKIQPWHEGNYTNLVGGLKIRMNAGEAVKNDTFDFDVFGSVESVADPTKSFDGFGNDRAGLEWGKKVTAGQLNVNGIQITVDADDSINSVLQKISDSDAGVNASYDYGTEKVTLETKEGGSDQDIELGSDSSGFFTATKLENSSFEEGLDDDRQKVLKTVGALSPIKSGTMTVNGVDIAVDRKVDSLNDVIDRINASEADVTASFDATEMKFEITANAEGQNLELDDGNTFFFSTMKTVEGTHEPTGSGGPSGKEVDADLRRFARKFEKLAARVERDMNQVFQSLDKLGERPDAGRYKKVLAESITRQFTADPEQTVQRSEYGLDFDVSEKSTERMNVKRKGRRGVVESFVRDQTGVKEFVLGKNGHANRRGFVHDVDKALQHMETGVSRITGRAGLLINTLI